MNIAAYKSCWASNLSMCRLHKIDNVFFRLTSTYPTYVHTYKFQYARCRFIAVNNCFWFSLFTQLFGLPHPSITDHQCTGLWPTTCRLYWQQNAGSINGPFNQSWAFDVFFGKENFFVDATANQHHFQFHLFQAEDQSMASLTSLKFSKIFYIRVYIFTTWWIRLPESNYRSSFFYDGFSPYSIS